MKSNLVIRLADEFDLNPVIALRIAAEEWLHASGADQWRNRERGIQNIEEGIQSGKTFVVVESTDRNAVVATITLSGPDLDWWHHKDNPDDALYLYKFIISNAWRGTGLGNEILDWACGQAGRQGKTYLRLDCWRTNLKLHGYYKSRAFRHIRTESLPGRGSGALFERDAKARTANTQFIFTE